MVQLTSNASRSDAHHFYANLGFEQSHLGFKMHLTRTPDAPFGDDPDVQ